MTRTILWGLLSVSLAQAFIPPVPAIVREVFDGRKSFPAVEVFLRHRVDGVEVEERILSEGGKIRCVWRLGNQLYSGSWEKRQYVVEGGGQYPSTTSLFLRYLLSASADDFLTALAAEQFTRRDQWLQFKPGFKPEGDPTLWEVNSHYLRHPDIFLSRLKHGIAITVVGLQDPNRYKAVHFDEALKGIRRLEWKGGDKALAWEFDGFSAFTKEGFYPKFLYGEVGGAERIRSELVQVRPLSPKQVAEFVANYRRGRAPTGAHESTLQTLLSFR